MVCCRGNGIYRAISHSDLSSKCVCHVTEYLKEQILSVLCVTTPVSEHVDYNFPYIVLLRELSLSSYSATYFSFGEFNGV